MARDGDAVHFRGYTATAPLKRSRAALGHARDMDFRGYTATAPLKQSLGWYQDGPEDISVATQPRPH